MKRLIFGLLVFVSFSVSAQVIQIDSVIRATQTNADSNVSFIVSIPIKNLTADTIKVNWKRLSVADSNWSTLICDLNNCYQANQSFGPQTSAFPPNTTKNFTVTFNNNYLPGTGHTRLEIYAPGDTITTDVYLTASNAVAAGIKAVDPESLKIYPNPAMDFILVQNQEGMAINRVELYSMLGRKVLSQKVDAVESTSRIDLSDMPKGIYMVRVFDEENNVVLTKSISHLR